MLGLGSALAVIWGSLGLMRDSLSQGLHWHPLEQGDLIDSSLGSGSFTSREQRLISADEAGVLELIYKRPGETVTAGEVLFQLKNPQLQQELESASIEEKKARLEFDASQESLHKEMLEAKLSLAQAKIDLKIAEADLAANRTLLEKNVISQLRYAQFEAASLKASNQAEAAQQRLFAQESRAKRLSASAQQSLQLSQLKLQRLQARLASLQLRSPITGLLKKLTPQLGDAITAGRALAEVGPLTADGARLRMPQREISRLKPDLPVRLSFNNQQKTGKILRVEPDPREGYVVVEVSADLPETARVDMAVQGEVQFAEIKQTCFIKSLLTLEPGQSLLEVRVLSQDKPSAPQKISARSVNGHLVFDQLTCKAGDKLALLQK